MKRKVLGIIGGVGPLSTAYFMEVVIHMTAAETDQQHIDMIVLNHTEIPDRTEYILNHSKPNPIHLMKEDAQKLEKWDADIIVTPCNTAHYFYHELASSVKIPFLNMIDETALFLSKIGAKRVGILATNGTIHTELFQIALKNKKIEPFLPSINNQQFIMDIIYNDIKAGKPVNIKKWNAIINEMKSNNCDKVILGCTELSILKKDFSLDHYYVDALEVLAAKAIQACGKIVKKSYFI